MSLSPALRSFVYERARGCCEYCRSQAEYATQSFQIEHIMPRSLGGSDEPDNLALSCPGCNAHKYNKITGMDPLSRAYVLLFNPRLDKWSEHFAWSPDTREIMGLTLIGRATERELKLNRRPLTKLRKVLFEAGEHPPPED